MNERQCNQFNARGHHIPPINFPYKVEEIEQALYVVEHWQDVLCPSSPYMCHDDNCGCRKNRKYRDVLR